MKRKSTSSKHLLPEVIKEHCGYFNTDILSGWEIGLGGRERIGGRLFDRHPPEHLTGNRYLDWQVGYEAAKKYKSTKLSRCVYCTGYNAGEMIVIRRSGWSVSRRALVSQLERKGCTGRVYVVYFDENHNIVRTVECGI